MTTVKIGDRVFTLEVSSDIYTLRYVLQALREELTQLQQKAADLKGPFLGQRLNKMREEIYRLNSVIRVMSSVIHLKRGMTRLPKGTVDIDLTHPLLAVVIDNLQKRNN